MTTPNPPRPRLLQRLVEKGRLKPAVLYVSWIGVVLGIIWVFIHPIATVTTGEFKTRGTYFSENALLVDSTSAHISDIQASWAKGYHKEYINLDSTDENGCELHSTCTHVLEWIESKLRAIPSVEVYRQEYKQHLFDSEYVNRTNVYAILRGAPLVDGKESIVLVAQYPNVPATNRNGYSALSIGISILRYLESQKWLAKDVILLLTDDGPNDGRDGYAPGVEAWLDAYHTDPFAAEALHMHAGLIRGAINLETSRDQRKYNAVGIFGAGINGQLPNLDLINSAVETHENERISLVLDRCSDSTYVCDDSLTYFESIARSQLPTEYQGYLTRLFTLLRFMKTVATGPSGPHANFINYNIDAITLTALHTDENHQVKGHLYLTNWLRAIEIVVRAISNLEEKFHQSFYFYLLVSPRSFVSIGEYYYPMVLMMLPLFAHTLFHATNTAGLRTAFAIVSFVVLLVFGLFLLLLTTHLSYLDPIVPFLDIPKDYPDTLSSRYCWTLVGIATMLQFIAVVVILPRLSRHPLLEGCVDEGQWLRQIHDHRKEFELTRSKTKQDKDLLEVHIPFESDDGWRSMKTLLAIYVILVHCALGIFNYPFAVLCTLPMTILVAFIIPASKSSVIGKTFHSLLLVILSPIMILLLMKLIHPNVIDTLAYFITSYTRHGLLIMPYLTLVYFPVHTLSIWIWTYRVIQTNNDIDD